MIFLFLFASFYFSAGRTTSPELQAADVDIVDNEQCDKLLRPMCNRNWCGIQEHHICAGKVAGGVDACQVCVFGREVKKWTLRPISVMATTLTPSRFVGTGVPEEK